MVWICIAFFEFPLKSHIQLTLEYMGLNYTYMQIFFNNYIRKFCGDVQQFEKVLSFLYLTLL